MNLANMPEVLVLINNIQARENVLKDIDRNTILKVTIKGGAVNIDALPVRNSINAFEKLAMVYVDAVKDQLQKELDALKQELESL